MPVYRACYCNRADVMTATDIKLTQDNVRHIDSALESAAGDIDGLTHRRFWNSLDTNVYDWPNFQRAYPWRVWLDQAEVADKDGSGPLGIAPVITTGVQSSKPQVIPLSALFWQPRNYGPPWNAIEINRSKSYSFGLSNTPQEDVSIVALGGYWTQTKPGGTLASAVASTSAITVTVSDSSVVSAGDVIIAGTEQMLVQDTAMADTGQAQQGAGCSTAVESDNILTVSSGAAIHAGEYLQLDGEWMLAESVTGNNVLVVRAVLGTVIATHSGAEVYAMRQLTVQRGFGNTTAATHTQGSSLLVSIVPGQVRELAIAEALNYVYQKVSAYARTIGENQTLVPGGSLPDLRDRVLTNYGRKARQRVIL